MTLTLKPMWQLKPVEGMYIKVLAKQTQRSEPVCTSVVYEQGKWLGISSGREYIHLRYWYDRYFDKNDVDDIYLPFAGIRINA